ncbi:MAG: hypothetical protein ABII09_02410 [Planctomycetota bacterium]
MGKGLCLGAKVEGWRVRMRRVVVIHFSIRLTSAHGAHFREHFKKTPFFKGEEDEN